MNNTTQYQARVNEKSSERSCLYSFPQQGRTETSLRRTQRIAQITSTTAYQSGIVEASSALEGADQI